jgi:hypothetical protein
MLICLRKVPKLSQNETGELSADRHWGACAGVTRETERGGPCRPIETEVNRDSGSTYGRVSFLGYVPQIEGVIAYSYGKIVLWRTAIYCSSF